MLTQMNKHSCLHTSVASVTKQNFTKSDDKVWCFLFHYIHKILVVTLKSFQVPLKHPNSHWKNIDFCLLYGLTVCNFVALLFLLFFLNIAQGLIDMHASYFKTNLQTIF